MKSRMSKFVLTIDDTSYERVAPQYPELSCDECDLEFMCEDIDSKFPYVCHGLSSYEDGYCIFNKL